MIALLVVFLSLLLVLRTGSRGLINVGDALFPFFPAESFRRSLYLWESHSVLGRDTSALISQLPWYGVAALLDRLGLPLWVINRLWFALPFFLLGASMYFLSGVIFGQEKKIPRLISTFFLMFNPFTLNLVSGSNILTLSFAAGVFVFGLLVRGLERFAVKEALLIGLVSIFATANIQVFAMSLLLCLAYFLFFVLVNRSDRELLIRAVKFLLFAFSFLLLVNSWWLLPFLYQFTSPGYFNTLFAAGTDVSTLGFSARFTSLFDVSRLFYGMKPTANFPISVYYHYLLAPTVMSVLVVLVFLTVLFKRKSKFELFFLLLAVFSVILASGTRPPFGFVYQFLWDHIPYFHIFRTTNRFNLYTMISYAILLGFLYLHLQEFFEKHNRRYLLRYFLFLILTSVFLSAWPLLSGDLFGQLKPHRVPQDYYQLREFLKRQEGDFRVMSLPMKDWLTPYVWSAPFDMQEILIDFSPKDTVVNLPGHLQGLKNRDLIENDPIYALIYRWPERPEALDALRKMGVRYLVVHRDYAVIWGNYYPLDVSKLTQTLKDSSGIELVRSFGDLDVYEVEGFYPRLYARTEDSPRAKAPLVVFKRISPVEYRIIIKDAEEPFDLVLAESFNPGWRLLSYGGPSGDLERGFGNVWRVGREGDYELVLFYWPQKLLWAGFAVSLLSLVLGLAVFVFRSSKLILLRRYLRTTLRLLRERNFRILYLEIFNHSYRMLYAPLFIVVRMLRRIGVARPNVRLRVETDHPIAYDSPDHLFPFGTKNDNSTNRKFVLFMDHLVGREFPGQQKKFLDLGCAGGQLVGDFLDLGWVSVGLEGSDYSLKRRRANWSTLANKNLFTADITKPFDIFADGTKLKFHLITAWEVLEHIAPQDLDKVFANIVNSLVSGGFFIATTAAGADVHGGVDFHQTKMSNEEWIGFITKKFSELKVVDLGLKGYQLVRYANKPYLTFRKR